MLLKNLRKYYVMQNYGYLLGKILLIKDNHHDEVFIQSTGLVVMENNIWLFNSTELVAIAMEILGED